MPKEITFAILIGFILGSLIMFGVYTANKAIKQQGKEAKTEAIATATPSPTSISDNTLTVSEPDNNRLFTSPETTISGKTSPNAVIAFLTEAEDFFVEADEDGFFSQEIELEGGANQIELISTDSFGSQAKVSLILSYSTKIKVKSEEAESDEKD